MLEDWQTSLQNLCLNHLRLEMAEVSPFMGKTALIVMLLMRNQEHLILSSRLKHTSNMLACLISLEHLPLVDMLPWIYKVKVPQPYSFQEIGLFLYLFFSNAVVKFSFIHVACIRFSCSMTNSRLRALKIISVTGQIANFSMR